MLFRGLATSAMDAAAWNRTASGKSGQRLLDGESGTSPSTTDPKARSSRRSTRTESSLRRAAHALVDDGDGLADPEKRPAGRWAAVGGSLGMRFAPVALMLTALGELGCATAPTLPPVSTPTGGTPQGTSSARFVVDPANPARGLPTNVELRAPVPVERLALPDYPPGPLAAGFGPATVGLRFVVDVHGDVETVDRSPLLPSTDGPFASEFRAAAEAVVRSWKFREAYIIAVEDGPDRDGDGKPDYKRATSLESVPVYLDVRIDFSILNGEGRVSVFGVPGGR